VASIAQEESRSISQNVTWGKRVGFQEGKVSFPYSSFLGYKKEDDKIVVDDDQAVIVKLIYKLFLVKGKTCSGIANYLKSQHIKTPSGKSSNWTKNTVYSILTNEKYKGDALLQKKFTDNYLEHSLVKNTGQIPQYYVENSHPAIIDRDMWEQVQAELYRRKKMGAQYSSSDIFATKLICEDCGGFYGKKKWHSSDKYSKFIYQCNKKFHKNKEKCHTPNLTEDDIKSKFILAYNEVMQDKERIIQDTTEIIALLTDTKKLDKEIACINDDLYVITELVNKLVKENSKNSDSLNDYSKKYEELTKRYEKAKIRQDEVIQEKVYKKGQASKMNSFLLNLINSEDELAAWNDRIWMLMVESAVVHRDASITFVFYNGSKIMEEV
jgi:site-specific DNA recombinase